MRIITALAALCLVSGSAEAEANYIALRSRLMAQGWDPSVRGCLKGESMRGVTLWGVNCQRFPEVARCSDTIPRCVMLWVYRGDDNSPRYMIPVEYLIDPRSMRVLEKRIDPPNSPRY
jgi:hypothetical protein